MNSMKLSLLSLLFVFSGHVALGEDNASKKNALELAKKSLETAKKEVEAKEARVRETKKHIDQKMVEEMLKDLTVPGAEAKYQDKAHDYFIAEKEKVVADDGLKIAEANYKIAYKAYHTWIATAEDLFVKIVLGGAITTYFNLHSGSTSAQLIKVGSVAASVVIAGYVIKKAYEYCNAEEDELDETAL